MVRREVAAYRRFRAVVDDLVEVNERICEAWPASRSEGQTPTAGAGQGRGRGPEGGSSRLRGRVAVGRQRPRLHDDPGHAAPRGDRDAGVPGCLTRARLPDCRFHDIRHAAAGHVLAQGMTLEDVQQLLGQSWVTLTSITYGHVPEQRQRQVARAMDTVATWIAQARTAGRGTHGRPIDVAAPSTTTRVVRAP
jgi:hypothetical protein